MNDWFSIGQFAGLVGVSAKALRLYEDMGILKSHTRGENGYRYYHKSQISLAQRLKEFKDLGFSLAEIKGLLSADAAIDAEKIKIAMQSRLEVIRQQADLLRDQKIQIENVLSSLDEKSKPLRAEDRRVIMNLYGKISIVVTGVEGLEKTANCIQAHFKKAKQEVPVLHWSKDLELPEEKPYILVVSEKDLSVGDVSRIHGDVIVIKNMSEYSATLEEKYLKLFSAVGPHMNTVVNADDRASVALVENKEIKKSRYFYYTKNRAFENQIKNIGGVVSSGEEVNIYGFNLKTKVHLKINRIMAHEEEIALISSLGAVMTVGLEQDQLSVG